MARVPYLNPKDLPAGETEVKAIFDQLAAERGGVVGNIFRALAHSPNLLRRFAQLGNELRNETKLDPKLRELALCTIGRLTGAEYEFTHHWNIARDVGVKREQLEALAEFERSPLFNEQERAVMRYAIEVTQNIKVSDATWDALTKFLDNRRLLELAHNVAFYNAVVRLLIPLGVELEPGVTKR
jgi:uncharacterized peroxidase-related enzyme